VRHTPETDSINWVREKDGVRVYANAHHDQNRTQYYQWDFEETWEQRSGDSSRLAAGSGTLTIVTPRREGLKAATYVCSSRNRSTNFLISSTAKLNSDIVYQYPLVFIPNISDKLSVKYSILVRQYAISRGAFEYLSLMKKNSEQTGSFFDSQPSDLIGNIR